MAIKPICAKCNKTFRSNYLLNKHLNQKIPCGTIVQFICTNCNKEFSSHFNLERHKNKKTPCLRNNVHVNKLQIEIEKTKQLELKLKNEIKEKELLIKKEMKEKELILKKELKEQQIALEREKIQAQKEKSQKYIEIEHIKSQRKERTAIRINQDNSTKNIVNITNNINNTYNYHFRLDEYDKKELKKEILSEINTSLASHIITKVGGISDMIVYCTALNFNNENYPELQYFKYDKENEIYFKHDDKEFKIVEFEDIEKEIHDAFDKTYTKIMKCIPEPSYEDEEFMKYMSIRNMGMQGKYNMKNTAGIGLLEDNKILLEL